MSDIKGSKTEINLMAAFAGESQARNRYTYYAEKARKEGYIQIASIFNETADQEREHAKRIFNSMQGGEIEITGSFPAGPIGNTAENLIICIFQCWVFFHCFKIWINYTHTFRHGF